MSADFVKTLSVVLFRISQIKMSCIKFKLKETPKLCRVHSGHGCIEFIPIYVTSDKVIWFFSFYELKEQAANSFNPESRSSTHSGSHSHPQRKESGSGVSVSTGALT